MGLPIEDEARERVVNNAELNIANAKREALRAIAALIPEADQAQLWVEDMELVSYNSIRNTYVAMFTNWKFPDKFISVQYTFGSFYTSVSQNLLRDSNHSQMSLPGL